MPLKLHEEVKTDIARMVDNCQSCKDGSFCQECREDIEFFQEDTDYDVTDYISKTVPEDFRENNGDLDE